MNKLLLSCIKPALKEFLISQLVAHGMATPFKVEKPQKRVFSGDFIKDIIKVKKFCFFYGN